MKQERFRVSLALALSVAIIFGFLAGVVGELWINGFLAPDIQFKSYRDLTQRLDDLVAERRQALSDILTEGDYSFLETVNKIKPVTATIYYYKKSGSALDNVYLPTEALGSGFSLTSDGWIVTTKQVVRDAKLDYVVAIDGATYEVTQIVADVLTDAVFIKTSATNLPVAELGSKNSLNVGATLLSVTTLGGVKRGVISNLNFVEAKMTADLIHSSETFSRFPSLAGSFDKHDLGAPVVNLSGKVVGLVTSAEGLVLPLDYFVGIIKPAIQDGRIYRNYLGVNYLDLTQAVNFTATTKKGALVMGDRSRRAVVANSPAASNGLLSGDIIIKVDNIEVNENRDLTQLIQDYPAEATVRLTINRAGQEQTIELKLEKF
jgi:serine protease Do